MNQVNAKHRDIFPFFLSIQTRWADHDFYGQLGHASYYSYFETAANALLIQNTGFDPQQSLIAGRVVDSACSVFQEISFPEVIEVGVAIAKIGECSLHYELAVFRQDQHTASAQGHLLQVFSDRHSQQSSQIPQHICEALQPYFSQTFDLGL